MASATINSTSEKPAAVRLRRGTVTPVSPCAEAMPVSNSAMLMVRFPGRQSERRS